MTTLDYFLAAWALLGHGALWIGVFNVFHALGLPCRAVNLLEKVVLLLAVAPPTLLVLQHLHFLDGLRILSSLADWLLLPYFAFCGGVAIYALPGWLANRLRPLSPALASNHTQVVDVRKQLAERAVSGRATTTLAAIPGNQICLLAIQQKTLLLPRLPAELDGLSIVHLSDLHFTGGLTLPYFQRVIEEANALECDLAVVTGDIIDKPACLDWIPQTLGRLKTRLGGYFVLGNHDQRAGNTKRLRQLIETCGLVDLGGRWISATLFGADVILAGNEAPWFPPKPDMSSCPTENDSGRPFRILLSHSPDQYPWAQRHDFDLVLAGHVHGGQVCLPIIGPIVAPSRFGVKYASGVFFEPPTVMHVSRGVSALHPLRWNCPPELSKLVLKHEFR